MRIQRMIRIVLSILLIAVFLMHSIGVLPLSLIERLENIAYDLRLNTTLLNTVDERIVIIDLDEKSVQEIERWPWSRHILANMVDVLFDHYQIKTLGFDQVFPEKDQSSGIKNLQYLAEVLSDNEAYQTEYAKLKPDLEYDRLFAESFDKRSIVLGYVFQQRPGQKIGKLPPAISAISPAWRERIDFISAQGYTANLAILQDHAATAGFFDNPVVGIDGVFRRVPLMQEYDGRLYESLALAVTRAALDFPPLTVNIATDKKRGYSAVEQVQIGNLIVLVDASISALVPYRGKQYSFNYYSTADVIHKRVPSAALKNKIVLLGTTAPGLLDMRSTPVQNVYPGVEVHANLISGILDQRIKHTPAYAQAAEITQLLLVGILMIILLSYLSPLWTSMFTAGLLTLIIALNMTFWEKGIVIPIASSLLLIIALFVLQMSYGFFIESRGKRAISKLFGQYIPPELVDEMNDDPQDITLEGQSREMSVLFSDVRGFTSISEGLQPKELTQLMNEILTPLTRVIHKHRGTIDKYMGDAIMAFWGAPLEDKQHAKNAMLAGIEMIKVLEDLQPLFKQRGWPEIKVGVGINTGIMNVGNMGSEFRMAYTVLGDAVNLGSRLEGLTKSYGVAIMVSESTKAAVSEFEYLELDRVRVKGKDAPVTIYEPLGYAIELDKETKSNTRRFAQALKLYRQQNWDAAEREIFSLAQRYKDKQLYKIYLDRIMYYRNHSPGEQWDGVFTHVSK